MILGAAAAAGGLLSACARESTSAALATGGNAATGLPAASATPEPTAAARRPEVVRFYPDVPSKVVRARHAGVSQDGSLSPAALREMLDSSITELTGLYEASEAWGALFAPEERVAIKVNAGWSGIHPPLVMAVTERLQQAGVPPEKIVIYEDHTTRLEIAGFPINEDGPGVRCYGDAGYDPYEWTLVDEAVMLNSVLMSCDALINMPVLKTHSMAGISCALKNHYGSFHKPSAYHHPRLAEGIGGLNALPPIRDRTRLIVADALDLNFGSDRLEESILMGFDPVAIDAVGLQLCIGLRTSAGRSTEATLRLASGWLEAAARRGVGTNDPRSIELAETDAG